MAASAIPIHAFFGAIHGHFFPDDAGRPGALQDAVHLGEDEERAAGPSFRLPEAAAGGLDLVAVARERPDIYAEAFQVAVARLVHREQPAYDAYFALVLEAFESLFGPGSAPLRAAPA